MPFLTFHADMTSDTAHCQDVHLGTKPAVRPAGGLDHRGEIGVASCRGITVPRKGTPVAAAVLTTMCPAGFNPHVRFMTPYLDSHDDLSGAVFLSLVGFWELERDEVPADYFEVRRNAEINRANSLAIILFLPIPTRGSAHQAVRTGPKRR